MLQKKKRNVTLGAEHVRFLATPGRPIVQRASLGNIRLLPCAAVFLAGRLVSYTIYGLAAKGIQATSLGDAFRDGLTSPVGISLQIAMLGALVLLMKLDWAK